MSTTKSQNPKKAISLGQAGSSKTATIIQALKTDFGLNQNALVELSGYSPRSIVSWGSGTKAAQPAKLKFTELKRLFDALAELNQDKNEVLAWLKEPNKGFEGSTPLQVIARGESDRIWNMIYMLRSGQPG